MIDKEQFLNSVIQECKICKYLYTKIPPDKFDYRPAENMRSILELLQYLTFAPYEFALSIVNDSFATKNWASYAEAEKLAFKMKGQEFPDAMDKQIEKFKELFSKLDEKDLINREVNPGWSVNNKLGAALVDHSLKVATAYRMQLFIYLKSSVSPDLHSGDCWSGTD